MKSVMTAQQYYNKVQQPNIPRSKFDMSSGYKTTMNAGLLIPVYLQQVGPGDTFNVKAFIQGRMLSLIRPIMDNIQADLHFFSVANRNLWDNWKPMMGEQKDPSSPTNFIAPTLTAPVGGFAEASLYDYMGVPTKVPGLEINALFNRAQNAIYNYWYRDENLQPSTYCPTDDGPDDYSLYLINSRGKRKDQFTSALPWAQKHTPVLLPIGGSAQVISNGNIPLWSNAPGSTATFTNRSFGVNAANNDVEVTGALVGGTGVGAAQFGSETGLQADLSTATATTINALREAIVVQQIYELDARGGTRYTEMIYAHFGVISPDARQQNPEYLGGGTTNINVTPIAQTSSSTDDSPQANLAAMATLSMKNTGYVKSFTEHEIVVGFLSIRADLNYQQGLPRKFSQSTRLDYYLPSTANLGEEPIFNKEIYAQGPSVLNPGGVPYDDLVFGYQERWYFERYKNSIITGLFRSNADQSLDSWGLWQDFGSLPSLNSEFIKEQPPIQRVVALQDQPQFQIDIYFNEIAARPMPTFSIPGLNKL